MKRCKKLLSLIMVLTLIITSSMATVAVQAANSLTPTAGKTIGNSNSLITHKYGADPFAMVYGGRVYIYMTDDQAQWELTPDTSNSYSNCRSISIISSADMVNWTDHGKVPVGRQLENGLTTWANNSWAPAATYKTINGKEKFFLYFADSANGIGVLEAGSPIGPFHDPLGHALISRSTPNCESSKVPWLFDPAVLVDDDGKAYLYFAGGIDGLDANNPKSARCVQLGEDMISIVGIPQEIDAPRLFEDSGIHKFNGKYYYSYCSNFSGSNGDGYPPTGTIAYMVSDNPLGPFTYIGPILPGPGSLGNGDGGNNHHAIFKFEDNWYITYHTRQVNIAQRQLNGQTGSRDYRSPSITQISIDPVTGLITPLQMEMKGVSSLNNMDPYTRVEAETIGWNGGISTEICSQPGAMVSSINMNVCNINDGDWTAVSKVDFGSTGAGTFTANVVCASSGGTIELRLDSGDGTLIGTLPISNTGGDWKTVTTNISGATGVHDVYMVFKGASTGDLFKIDYWQFGQKSEARELAAINASIDKQKIDIVSGTNTANINVTAIYTDGTSEDITAEAAAIPEQSGIISVDSGVVTGVGYGSTSINISYGGKTDVLYITVKDLNSELTVKKLSVDKSSVTLDAGSTTTFKVTAEYFDGHTEDITNKATYSNLHPEIAEVANGTITAKSAGTTSIIVSYKGTLGDTKTAQIFISVSNLSAPVKYIIRNSNPVYEGPAKRVYGDVIGYLDAGTDGGPDGAVTFTVNVPAAGTYKMSLYNVVYGGASHKYTINGDTNNTIIYTYPSTPSEWKLSPFSQDITLNAGDNTIKIAFNSGAAELQYIELQSYSGGSEQVPITGVSLNKSLMSLEIDDEDTLVATVSPSTATDKTVIFVVEGSAISIGTAVFNSDDGTTSVNVKAEKEGTAIIKAYAGGFESSCSVTVTPPVVEEAKWVGNIWYDGTVPAYFADYWNQITPENATKWASCESQQGVYNFNAAKSMYDYSRTNGIPFKFHTLVWGSQYPRWMDNLSAEDQKTKVENWIKNAGLNFPDAEYVDVVNEPMPGHAPPTRWKNAIGGDNDLYGTGWDWIVWSFEKAREYFPNSKLLINDYNILSGYTSTDAYINVINILKSRGLIDGIGCQGHGLDNTSAADVKARLDKLAATGLPIHISEFDLNIADDTIQKNKMQELFPVFYEHPAVEGITLWGYLEGHTWIANSYLIRSDGTERPALVWLKEYLGSIPPSVIGVTLDNSTLSLLIGESAQLTATIEPADAANKDVAWESDNTSVAIVDNTGKVTAVSAGTATITVITADGGKTATCTVTVIPPVIKVPEAVLTADSSVKPGATFTVGIGLDKLDKSVYAEDITLSFDSNVFEYISASGVDENIQIVREGKPTDGKVRFIVANIGGISGDSTEVMNVTFKVKAGVLSTTGIIAITDAKLGVAPEGTVIEADLDSKSIKIEDAQPVIDKTALIAAIDNAQSLYDAAEVGTEPGQYPQKAKDTFGAAIDVAKAVRDNSSATQSQVDNAVTALNSAVDTFKEAVIKEVSADINNDGIIDVADLAFVAYYYGKDSTFVDWEVAKIADMNGDNKIDILDLAYVALKILD